MIEWRSWYPPIFTEKYWKNKRRWEYIRYSKRYQIRR